MVRTKQTPNKIAEKSAKKTPASVLKGLGSSQKKTHPKKRAAPGSVALNEIVQYQKDGRPLIQDAPFRRLVREISGEFSQAFVGCTFRCSAASFGALREASEAYISGLFGQAQSAAHHAGRVTVKLSDLRLVTTLHNDNFSKFSRPVAFAANDHKKPKALKRLQKLSSDVEAERTDSDVPEERDEAADAPATSVNADDTANNSDVESETETSVAQNDEESVRYFNAALGQMMTRSE